MENLLEQLSSLEFCMFLISGATSCLFSTLVQHKLVTGLVLDSDNKPDPICEPCIAGKTAYSTLGVTQLPFEVRLCILVWLSVTTAGAGVTQLMPVALKVLSVKSAVDHTEWKTTDPWPGVAKLTPSLTLLERPRQMVLTAPIPSSVKLQR